MSSPPAQMALLDSSGPQAPAAGFRRSGPKRRRGYITSLELDPAERQLLDELAEVQGVTRGEILRRGLHSSSLTMLPVDELDLLDRIARQEGVTRAEVLSRGLRQYANGASQQGAVATS